MLTREYIDTAPIYYKDWVLYCCRGTIYVTDCESYHVGEMDNPAFSSDHLADCLAFIEGAALDPLASVRASKYGRLLAPFLRLYFRLSKPILPFAETYSCRDRVSERALGQRVAIEYAGWLKPFMDTKVGTHPVFNFTSHPPSGFRFVQSKNRRLTRWQRARGKLSVVFACLRYTRRFLRKGIPLAFIIKFWATRGFDLEHLKLMSGKQNIALYPTYLFFVPNHSWLVEIEDMLTLMVPFVSNGTRNALLHRSHPIVKTLEVLFESDACKAVISHLGATAEGLRLIFADNNAVVRKIHHIPLGMELPPRKVVTKKQTDAVHILFLSGWAQDKRAAYRRGLLDALKAFALISSEFDNVTLTVRCNLPALDDEYMDILSDNKVVVLNEKLPLRKMQKLYDDADILLFPAVRIAVTTLLQAMANSLVIVASDGFGIEEYVKDGMNGLIARGFRNKAGWIDEEGIFRENYMLSLKSNPEVFDNCARHLRRLIKDRDLRIQMQNSAREYAEAHFTMQKWNERLAPILMECVGTHTN